MTVIDPVGSASLSPVEESPDVLANKAVATATPTKLASAGSNRVPPHPEGEEASGHNCATDAEPSGSTPIVRATARLKLDSRFACSLGGNNESASGESWKALQGELYQTQRDVASGKNAVIRALWAAEGAMFDEFVREHGRKPKTKKEWPDSKLNVYKIARTASPDISGAMAAVASRSAWKKWVQTRYDALVRQSCSPPHYRDTCPIPLRAKEVRIVKADDKASKDYMVDFTLRSGRGQRWRVRVQPRDAYQRTVLKNIANGTWKHGDAMIERDRKNRWHLKFSYKRFVQEKSKGKTAAINRGIRTFLACAVDDGERWIYDANDIIAYLKQIQTRRKKYQWDSKASARSGRGRKRILRPTKPLMDKAARWRATKCQTIARRLVRWLDKRGVKTLLVEDFSKIRDTDLANERVVQLIQEWPYYQLEQRIRSCCEEAGIEVISLDPKYISQRCPSCGHTDEKNRDMVRWKLSCTKCKYREHLDIAAAKNLLGRDLSELSPKVAN